MSKTSVNTMTSEEVCEILHLTSLRSLVDAENFPKPFFNEKELLFNKDEIAKYFNVDNIDEPFMTLNETAEFLNIHPAKLYKLTFDNEIPSYRVKSLKGSGHLYRKSELQKFKDIQFEGDHNFVNYFVGSEIIREMFLNILIQSERNLDQRNYKILSRYFVDRLNLVQIAEEEGLTRERVRQIIAKEIKRISKQKYYSPKEYVALERKVNNQEMEIKYLKTLAGREEMNNDESFKFEERAKLFAGFLRKRLTDFDLSTRALNSLRVLNITNMYDLSKFCYGDNFRLLAMVKNAGRKTSEEVKYLLEENRIKLLKETDIDLRDLLESEALYQANHDLLLNIKSRLDIRE